MVDVFSISEQEAYDSFKIFQEAYNQAFKDSKIHDTAMVFAVIKVVGHGAKNRGKFIEETKCPIVIH